MTQLAFSGRRFRVLERLGTGAHGDVYLAEQESPGGFRRQVALKVVNLPTGDPRARTAAERMREEARLLGRLRHPDIVDVFDLVQIDGTMFPTGEATVGAHAAGSWGVVMEPIDGFDLADLLGSLVERGERCPPKIVLEVGAVVAGALHAAWTANDGSGGTLRILHRDIKPANIMITKGGAIKVLDFGIARMSQLDEGDRSAKFVGTPRYMAPERLASQADGREADVYSLAIAMIELAGALPAWPAEVDADTHAAWRDEALATMAKVLAEGGVEVGVAEPFVELLRSALSGDPAARPDAASFGERCAAVAALADGPSLAAFAAEMAPLVERHAAELKTPQGLIWKEVRTQTHDEWDNNDQELTMLYQEPEPARRRARWPIAAGFAVALGAAGAAGAAAWWFLQPAPPEPVAPAALRAVIRPAVAIDPPAVPVTPDLQEPTEEQDPAPVVVRAHRVERPAAPDPPDEVPDRPVRTGSDRAYPRHE